MVRHKKVWWKKLVMAAVVSAAMLSTALATCVPKATAAPLTVPSNSTFTWQQNNYIRVDNSPRPDLYSYQQSSYFLNCAPNGAAGKYLCTADELDAGDPQIGKAQSIYGDGSLKKLGPCGPELTIDQNSAQGTIKLYSVDGVGKTSKCVDNLDPAIVTLANTTVAPADLTDKGTTGETGENADDTTGSSKDIVNPELECGKFFSLNWVLCPLYHAINNGVQWLDGIINTLLTVDQAKIFCTKAGKDCPADAVATGTGYFGAWSAFRTIALALIVIAALVMVISSALGFQILDAYTIKKIVPRLLIAAIAISLSWYLMKFLVVFTNDVGLGVRQIIYNPFAEMPGAIQLQNGSAFVAALLGAGAFLTLGAAGLLSFAGTAALALFVAFLVLMIRQLVIIVLVLFAPIAIACSILPNTQGVYKLWYESFTKALMMFPIIVAFIAVGRVFAMISIGTDITAIPAVSQLMGFAAYFLPYFLIPLTFSLAGGAMRFLGGQINDRNRGGFDRLKKFRGAKMEQNMHKMKEGNRFRGNNKLARGFNSLTHNAAMLPSAGVTPWNMRSRFTAAKAQHAYDAAEEIRTKNTDFALGAQDDRLLKAIPAKGRSDIRASLMSQGMRGAELDNGVGIVERMQATGSRESVMQAAAIQRFATGTGYNDADGNFSHQDAMSTIAESAEGDRNMAGRILGTAKGEAARAGQLAFGGASYGTLDKGLSQAWSGQAVDGNAIALNAFEGNDANSVSRARAPHVKAMTNAASKRINDLRAGAAPRDAGELGRLTAQFESWRDGVNMYASPERQTVLNNEAANSKASRDAVRRDADREDFRAVYNINTGERMTPPSADNVQLKRNRSARPSPYDPNVRDQGDS